MKINITTTAVFTANYNAYKNKYRYIMNEGGSRSSKTRSILQILFIECINTKMLDVVIVMKTLAQLKDTIIKTDLPAVLEEFPIKTQYNKSSHTITFHNGSRISFVGADDEYRVKGIASNILWIDEANELQPSVMRQLFQRCTGQIFISYNPSGNLLFFDEIYNKRDGKSVIIKSTYKDNPFLSQYQIDELEGFKDTDENHYRVYTLGLRGIPKEAIYTHYEVVKSKPENKFYDYVLGIDFGYHTNAMAKVWFNNNREVYIEEVIYSHGQDSDELIQEMMAKQISFEARIIGDSAAPMVIKSIKKAGFDIEPYIKKPGSVLNGINNVKQCKLYINENSINLLFELSQYKWKKVAGNITNTPVKEHDHLADSLRMVIDTLFQEGRLTPSQPKKRFIGL